MTTQPELNPERRAEWLRISAAMRSAIVRASEEFQRTGIAPPKSDTEIRCEAALPDLFQIVADFSRIWRENEDNEPVVLTNALLQLADRAERLVAKILVG